MYKCKSPIRQSHDVERYADGTPVVVSVDGFPCSDSSLYNDSGWPMSEITILNRFSTQKNVSRAEVERIATRIERIKAEPSNKLSDEELLARLKPAWCQTASEVVQFELTLQDSLVKPDVSADKPAEPEPAVVPDDASLAKPASPVVSTAS